MRKGIGKKMISMFLATSMVVGTTLVSTGCAGGPGGAGSNEPITLTVYSQVANTSGLQQG